MSISKLEFFKILIQDSETVRKTEVKKSNPPPLKKVAKITLFSLLSQYQEVN